MLSSQLKGIRKRTTRPILLHRPKQIGGANEHSYATRCVIDCFCGVDLLSNTVDRVASITKRDGFVSGRLRLRRKSIGGGKDTNTRQHRAAKNEGNRQLGHPACLLRKFHR
jgi:hypothetical protein